MKDVLNIEDGVLKKCTDKSVTSVVIPEGVTKIDYRAFEGCSSLSSVVIPSGVTAIDDWAFEDCRSLASVVIPSSVTAIGEKAFYECTSLSSMEFCGTVAQLEAVKGKKNLCAYLNAKSVKCADGEWQKPVVLVENGVAVKCLDRNATSVTIPEGVTEIGEEAFEGCSSLASVVIPESVTGIGRWAFSGCESLSSVSIPSSVAEIGWGAFAGCSSLSSVVIPSSVTAIGSSVFSGCTALSSVVIPSSVTEIGGDAFRGCSSLTSVVIPESVTEIGYRAFYGCSSLSSVVIPSSVTEIGGDAFEDCKSLAKVTLGDDFKKVPSEWFDDLNRANPNYEIVCTEGSSTYKAIKRSSKLKLHLKSLNVTKEDLELQKVKNAKIAEVQKAGVDAILPMLLEGVADSSFSLLSNTKSATVAIVQVGRNTGVFKLGADSSKWLPKLQKVIEAMADSTKSGREIYDALLKNKLPLAEIPAKKAENLTLKAGADKTVRLFCKGWTLHSIFPKDVRSAELFGVTEIGGAAFRGCTALASVVIPASVTEIGGSAFDGCESLASVVIPASVTEIGVAAFEGCTSLSSVVIPESVTEIDVSAFEGCTSLSSVVIPESVTEIDKEAFKGCTALASVVIPESVTEIGRGAFEGCESLTSVVIPNSVTEIGRGAFEGCESLTAVEFGGTMAQWDAVNGKMGLLDYSPAKSVKCADGEWQKPVVLVEDGVVVKCLDKSAASVEIPAGVTTIGWRAFQDCTALASVVIPESVTSIVGFAFCGCTSLESVSIPSSVKKIGDGSFYGCESLSSVEFGGTVAQWEAVEKGYEWHYGVPATSVKCADGEAKL